MSGHYPPDHGRPGHNPSDDAPATADGAVPANPYLHRAEAETGIDLDAAAPTLTVNEVRQFNRKALLFLFGIIGLLLSMAFWFMHSLSNREVKASKQGPAETVTTPDLPDATPALPVAPSEPAEPIELSQEGPPLPPLPPSTPRQFNDDVEPEAASAREARRIPTLVERRMGMGDIAQGTMPEQPGMPATPPDSAATPALATTTAPKSSARRLYNPDTLMLRGTYLRCVLETRIITDVAGYTSCVVSEPVYSVNGRQLLLPKGTRLLGQYGSGQVSRGRVAVVWDRAVTPTGLDVTMASPGIDNLGGAGHPGSYDAHWGSRISSALLISLVSDLFKYAGEKYGPDSTAVYPSSGVVMSQPFQSNTAQTVQQLAQQALQESANRRPTVTLSQGSVVNVYVAQDVDFSDVLRGR